MITNDLFINSSAMKRLFTLILTLLSVMFATAQSTITVKFIGRTHNGTYHQMKSIKVANLTQGWEQTLIYPDTTLILNYIDGVEEGYVKEGLAFNYPNPFRGSTEAVLGIMENSHADIQVFGIDGRMITSTSTYLTQGAHHIKVSLADAGMAILRVKTAGNDYALKIMSLGGESNSVSVSTVANSESKPKPTRNDKAVGGEFEYGDLMSYYAEGDYFDDPDDYDDFFTNIVTQPQTLSETITLIAPPEGAKNGKFSVSATKQVLFSMGNLQYSPYNSYWRFAWEQTDHIGMENEEIYEGYMDLFGWGATSSYSTNVSDYSTYVEWGSHPLFNGDNSVTWRTLSNVEWEYLLFSRTTLTGARFAKANVNNVNGLIILPDDWNTSYYSLSNINSAEDTYFSSNTINSTDWANKFEVHGAIFLPAAGDRYGSGVANVGIYGCYWSSTPTSTGNAYSLEFNLSNIEMHNSYRPYGLSVRLVTDDTDNPNATIPTVVTGNFYDVQPNRVTFNCEVTNSGGLPVTARGVCYSTSANPTITDSHTANGTGSGSYTSIVPGLTASTTYYARAYATNGKGTAYGAVKTFTTAAATIPTIETNHVTNITYNHAVCGGIISSDGGTPITAKGICWTENNEIPTLNNNHAESTSQSNSFSCPMNLAANKRYYVRAYATNSVGTAYGTTYVFYTPPIGAYTGLYSISGSTKVWFSKGNLQYRASSGTWRFADAQNEYIGENNENISSSYSGWIDLFGWGTGNNPTKTSTSDSNYGSFTDWGVNPISNGGNTANQWRTLTKDEWNYLINIRSTVSGIRFANATVGNVYGVIILPDDWLSSYYTLNNVNSQTASYLDNVITLTNWTNFFESHGATFLPKAGNRIGTEVNLDGYSGFYWSSTADGSNYAYLLYLTVGEISTRSTNRHSGFSVRLVKDLSY